MRRLPATSVYYALELLLSAPTWVVVSVYLVIELHLSPLQLVLMGTAMEASVFLFEVPTGVVADTFGRRLSLTIGLFGTGTTWLLVGVVSSPWLIVALWAAWGISHTFTSGAYEAWITDEVCLLLMPETGFRRRPAAEREGPFAELRRTASTAARFVRAQPLLLLIIGIALFVGLSAEAFDRLKEAHFLRNVGLPSLGHFDPVIWFGALAAIAMVFGFFALGVLQRRFERSGTGRVARLLFTFTALLFLSQLLFALTGSPAIAIGAVLTALLARDVIWPLWMTWVNQQVTDSSVRATVLSMTGQADAVGQAAAGPVLGVIANVYGIGSGLAVGALFLLPALGLYARALRHGGREPELQELPAEA